MKRRNAFKTARTLVCAAVTAFAASSARAEDYLVAHAGAMGTQDNTLESLRVLVGTGADAIEVDVSCRPSGTPVIIHKEKPEENEGELLDEALAIIAKTDKAVVLDFKMSEPDFMRSVADMIVRHDLADRTIISGVGEGEEAYARMRTCCPGMHYEYNWTMPKVVSTTLDEQLSRIAALKPWALNTNYTTLTPEVAEAVRAHGLRLSLWTATTEKGFAACRNLGAYSITTRWIPSECKSLRPARSVVQPKAYPKLFSAQTEAKSCKLTFYGYSGTTALTDFQALVRLPAMVPGFSYGDFAAADGSDIWFSDEQGNVIPHEIDTWNANGVSCLWVKVPELASAATFITMHWGEAKTAEQTTAATDVWTDYKGVWHLTEQSGTAADSTANGLTGTPSGSAKADMVADYGVVGNARINSNVSGKSAGGYLSVPSYELGNVFTVSGWFKTQGIISDCGRLFSRKIPYTGSGWEVYFLNRPDTIGASGNNGTRMPLT